LQILDFNTIIADAYLLARIFKTFRIDRKLRPTDEPAEPHNVIIYAGNAHSQRYRTFLKYIGFILVQHSGKLDVDDPYPNPNRTNCVDMRKIKQPLFSYCPYYVEDDPIDERYFGDPSLYYSFDSVFSTSFVGFTPFPQPVVPDDLLSSVSVDHTNNPVFNPRIEKNHQNRQNRAGRRNKPY